ncbi:hypothetical protein PVAND_011215 [Polypedilum vanderplanki]|uniref:Uncharacterized protein n=1 Tax=Polypedilum vanderplanki TaxID=319348 RepID=A0A9J6CIW3_POLVA|nr:hypothetical protein PVAND_011215 [Polypedilum vanderplanki]
MKTFKQTAMNDSSTLFYSGSLTTPPSPTLCSYGNSDVYFNFNNIHDEFYGSPRRFRSHSLSIPPTSRKNIF